MIDTTCSLKRRISSSGENERIALRQTLLNMSICKIQKDQGRKEPSLMRSVLISNTVRKIEQEMDEEMTMQMNQKNDFYPSLKHSLNSFSVDANNNLETEKPDEQNQFGAIGDKRKTKDDTTIKPSTLGYIWDPSSVTSINNNSLPPLDKMDFDNSFPDVDIALYDFDDKSSFFAPLTTPPPSMEWNYYPSSCASMYERKKPDSYFEELDQMMQVLVGM